MARFRILALALFPICAACTLQDKVYPPEISTVVSDLPAPSPVNLDFPQGIAPPVDTMVNYLRADRIELGRKLFYARELSRDSSLSCGDCHKPTFAFGDFKAKSLGVRGEAGAMNATALFNLAWQGSFFWDGRASSLEAQALEPVPHPKEMDLSWEKALSRLRASPLWRARFAAVAQADDTQSSRIGEGKASLNITQEAVVRAIADFERTLVSFNSRFDRWQTGKDTLSLREQEGYRLFFAAKSGCFLCHGDLLFGDFDFHNNGLDTLIDGTGRGAVTGRRDDEGKFKTPSLRNLVFSAPYMHDGRFNEIEEVLEHYSSGGFPSRTVDTRIAARTQFPLSGDEVQMIAEFLRTLTDSTLITHPRFQPP